MRFRTFRNPGSVPVRRLGLAGAPGAARPAPPPRLERAVRRRGRGGARGAPLERSRDGLPLVVGAGRRVRAGRSRGRAVRPPVARADARDAADAVRRADRARPGDARGLHEGPDPRSARAPGPDARGAGRDPTRSRRGVARQGRGGDARRASRPGARPPRASSPPRCRSSARSSPSARGRPGPARWACRRGCCSCWRPRGRSCARVPLGRVDVRSVPLGDDRALARSPARRDRPRAGVLRAPRAVAAFVRAGHDDGHPVVDRVDRRAGEGDPRRRRRRGGPDGRRHRLRAPRRSRPRRRRRPVGGAAPRARPHHDGVEGPSVVPRRPRGRAVRPQRQRGPHGVGERPGRGRLGSDRGGRRRGRALRSPRRREPKTPGRRARAARGLARRRPDQASLRDAARQGARGAFGRAGPGRARPRREGPTARCSG